MLLRVEERAAQSLAPRSFSTALAPPSALIIAAGGGAIRPSLHPCSLGGPLTTAARRRCPARRPCRNNQGYDPVLKTNFSQVCLTIKVREWPCTPGSTRCCNAGVNKLKLFPGELRPQLRRLPPSTALDP